MSAHPPLGSGADFAADPDGLIWALRRLLEARTRPGSPHPDPSVALDLPERLPVDGCGGRAALEALAGPVLDRASRLDHPGFLAHMDPPTPWPAWAAAQWTAATNQNLLHPDTAPVVRALEQRVVAWLAEGFCGMDGGHLVPGSTVGNLTALWAAREVAGATSVVASSAAHLSVAKSAHLLGMELVVVDVDERQRLRVDQLPADLSRAALVLTAGTVATGSIDPLDAGRDAAWRHMDAAWAGPLRFTRHADLLAGVEAADSLALSAHKWLYQPKESGLVLFADTARAHAALSFGSGYLAEPNIGLLGSRAAAAVPLAATLLAWGRSGLAARIEADVDIARQLARLVEADAGLELWAPPVTGVVNWRPRGADPRAVRDRLRGAWVSLCDIGGEQWFRSVAANPAADPGAVVAAVRAAW